PIPGTSTQNALPDCSRSAKESPKEDSPPTISSSRPWKKCPQASKEEFQRNVLKIFEILYSRHHQAEGVLEDQKGKILRWQFSVMDRNRDG
ncbi:SPARCrelated modular calciumbinding protein 1like, partial [Caligus rogercresseyi]